MEIRVFTGEYPWDPCLWERGAEASLDKKSWAPRQSPGSSGPLMVCERCAVLGPQGQALCLLLVTGYGHTGRTIGAVHLRICERVYLNHLRGPEALASPTPYNYGPTKRMWLTQGHMEVTGTACPRTESSRFVSRGSFHKDPWTQSGRMWKKQRLPDLFALRGFWAPLILILGKEFSQAAYSRCEWDKENHSQDTVLMFNIDFQNQ